MEAVIVRLVPVEGFPGMEDIGTEVTPVDLWSCLQFATAAGTEEGLNVAGDGLGFIKLNEVLVLQVEH